MSISPAGKLLGCLPVPEDLITNLAFGGQDKKTLYVTAGKEPLQDSNQSCGLERVTRSRADTQAAPSSLKTLKAGDGRASVPASRLEQGSS